MGVIPAIYGDNWWFNPEFKDSFEIYELDSFYPKSELAKNVTDAVDMNNYIGSVLSHGEEILGKEVKSIVEFGSCAGGFTRKLMELGIDVACVEGTSGGYELALENNIPADRVHIKDLRRRINLNKKFDVALCTEVAEHIETPFSSMLVETLTSHSDVIFFSSEGPGGNPNHYHHCNEQPDKFWINLFDFYGFEYIHAEPEEISLLRGRNLFLYKNKNLKKAPNDPK